MGLCPSGLRRVELDTQGSRGGNPGLEVLTASRYLSGVSFNLSPAMEEDRV